MLPLHDPQLRVALLHHLAVRLRESEPESLDRAGIEGEQLARLRELSAADLARLAGVRELAIGVALDREGLKAGLRAVALANEARALEAYFIRHGASWQMMKALFKLRRKLTLRRRQELGAWRPPGRLHLPDPATRERIYRAWLGMRDPHPRSRYLRLHQAFPQHAIAVLAAVVREFEEDR